MMIMLAIIAFPRLPSDDAVCGSVSAVIAVSVAVSAISTITASSAGGRIGGGVSPGSGRGAMSANTATQLNATIVMIMMIFLAVFMIATFAV
ncbi:MAG: hypothetical protein IJM08_02290 [Firmicutes bacterium]|nr:hypothetical protein [Bacillota bacterium]